MRKLLKRLTSVRPLKEWILITSVWLVVTISALNIIGRMFNIPVLSSYRLEWTPMRLVTALCLILYAVSLFLLIKGSVGPVIKIFVRVTALFILILSGLTVAVLFHMLKTGNESVLTSISVLKLFLAQETRMALFTSVIFFFLGLVLTGLLENSRRSNDFAHIILLPAAIFSYFVPVTYLLNIQDLFRIDQIHTSFNTGLALLLLCFVILLIRPDTWLMKIFTGRNAGSMMARRLIPGFLILPLLIAWLSITGEHEGYFSSEVGVSLVAITYTICLLILVWFSAGSVNSLEKKRQESLEGLRESEERLKFHFENSPLAVVEWDNDFIVTQWSSEAERIFGWTKEETLGKSINSLNMVYKEDIPILTDTMERLSEGKEKMVVSTNRNYTKTGNIIDCTWFNSVLTDKNGNMASVMSLVQDITERKKAEEELKKSEQKYAALFANKLNGMAHFRIITDEDGEPVDYRFLEVNEAYEQIIGVKKSEIEGRTAREIFPGIENYAYDRIRNYGRIALEGGEMRTEQYFEGTNQYFSIYIYSPVKGEFIAIFSDITERKKTEILLSENEARLKKSQEIGHLGSWELDLVNNILTWSDEIYRIFGLKPQEFQATYDAFLEAVHPDDREAVNNAYLDSLKENKDSYEIEHRVIRKETGEIRYVHEKCTHFRNSEGKIIKSLGMVHDITERKMYELALKESEERFRLKLESILSPEGDITNLDLNDIIDTEEIQEMMAHFYDLVNIPMAIVDLKGKVLVRVGWQDICTKFHRVHPKTNSHCIQSDTKLTTAIPEGEFKLYKCKNGMWDLATPIIIGGQHKGNLFMGQFFFDDERIDIEHFRSNASRYNFNEKDYIAALEKVPRINSAKLESAKGFFQKLADKISQLSYSNIKLARYASESERISKQLVRNNERLSILSDTAGSLLASHDPQKLVEQFCSRVMKFLDCQAFFNFIADDNVGKLHLNAYNGIPEKTAKSIEWLDYGVAVCGCVARDGVRIIAENIPETPDPRTELIKSFGIKAYCCHPILSKGKVLGTLSFGTKSRISFSNEEIEMMRSVTDLVSIAMSRIKDEQAIIQKEAETRKLNRTLNALGKSGQAMMQTSNETLYLQEVCRILVEECGHPMVWIGYAEDDEEKTVKPVAMAGYEEGYMEELHVTWADNERGRGPTGVAIRAGKPASCRNMMTDPAFAPWRPEAIKRGYRSSAVFPLIIDGKSIGAISVYSKEIDAFIPEEMELLTGLADDLSHGIATIRLKESENKAIAKLTESEEKYRMLFNGMLEGFAYHEIILDENGKPCDYRFLSMNPAFEKHTGLKAENVIGKKVSEVIPTLENYWINIYGQVATTGKSIEFENYNAQLNQYFQVSAFCPKMGYFAVIIENITERTMAVKELYNTKTYLESLINYANAPIIVWNHKQEIQLFNRAFRKLTGYSSSEVEGKQLDMLFPESSVKETNEKIRQALYENWESIEIPILTKSGEVRIVQWNSANIYDSDKKTLISTIAHGNDITERKKAEQRLNEAREKLELALDNGKIGTFERDFKTNRLIWDRRMEEMFGFEVGAFEGTYEAFLKCLVEEDIAHTREASRRAVEENIPFETVYRIKLPNGDINHINAKGVVIRDENGNALKMAGVCFDVTDMRKGAEKTLFNLNEELSRSNKELEQFAYVASHDLQEPLRMVSSFTQLLQKRYKDKLDDDANQFIKFAVDGANRMQGLINDLLDFSRIGTRGQKFSKVDFNEVVGRTISNLTMSIRDKNALIFSDKMPTVIGDENQLIQLMQNLVGNAIKFCNSNPHVLISAVEENKHYIFSVKDNGIGIEKDYFDKIFLIFQRLVPRDEYGGTGIGLAICKRIIERHGGRIWVESEVGEGSTFYFTLNKPENN